VQLRQFPSDFPEHPILYVPAEQIGQSRQFPLVVLPQFGLYLLGSHSKLQFLHSPGFKRPQLILYCPPLPPPLHGRQSTHLPGFPWVVAFACTHSGLYTPPVLHTTQLPHSPALIPVHAVLQNVPWVPKSQLEHVVQVPSLIPPQPDLYLGFGSGGQAGSVLQLMQLV
jgi:hypothetical protein